MKFKSLLTTFVTAATVALTLGLTAAPAVAQGVPTISTSTFDVATNTAWSGTEATGANAYDTASVTGDGISTPTGTVTYSFFANGTCALPASSTQTVTLAVDGSVPNSAPTGPFAAGGYSFQASYSGDSNFTSQTSACEPFTVNRATPSVATAVDDAATSTAWSGHEVVGARAYDTSTVGGVGTFTPTGTVTYSFFSNGSCTSSATSTQTVTLAVDGSVPNSGPTGHLFAGNYSFRASYSGDPNYVPAIGGCEPFSVSQATPSTATAVNDAATSALWSGHEVPGASAYDTSTVTGDGTFTPTGTVTYSFFPNGSCTGSATTTQTVTLAVDGSVPPSNATGPLAAGGYSFQASYSGDPIYVAATSSCEPFSVGPVGSSISTSVFDAVANAAWSGTEVTGASAYDTTAVTGDGTFTPTGTITYSFFPNGSCTGSPTTTQTVTLAVDGSVPNSGPTGPLAGGSYSYQASYSGDSNYIPAASGCEPFSVGQATPSTATAVSDAATSTPWSGHEVTGASAYDTSTVTGDGTFTPTGTVTYSFFSNGSCTGSATTTQTVTLAAGGSVPNSGPTGPLGAGNDSFQASYSGDSNYISAASGCEPFSVGQATPSTATAVNDAATSTSWSGSEVTGASAYDTATVMGISGFIPTGTVTYSFFMNGTCTSSALTQTVTLAVNGTVPPSNATGPLAAGGYSVEAIYSGDPNYVSATSVCLPFSVGQAIPSTTTSVLEAGTLIRWSGTEVTGASAYDTSTVSANGGILPTGTVTYSFFLNGTCTSTALTHTVTLAANGTVPPSNATGPLAAGGYSFQATYSGDPNYASATSSCEPFSVGMATPSVATTVLDASTNAAWSGSEVTGASAYDTATVTGVSGFTPTGTVTYSYFTNGGCTGTPTATQQVGPFVGVVPHSAPTTTLSPGTYSYEAAYGGSSNYAAATGSCEPFTVAQAVASPPTITNLPSGGTFGGAFVAAVGGSDGDGNPSVTSNTTGVCVVGADGLTVTYVGVGSCSLSAQVSGTPNFGAATGSPQTVTVSRAVPSTPLITNIPASATEFGGFTASVQTDGDGVQSVTSDSTGVCTVGPDGLSITYVSFGTCVLSASVGQGSDYLGSNGNPQAFTVNAAARGYWLVGSDGGIFSFGAAGFHGSMGGVSLQRPVVGITPTADRSGYWLVASDGGIFSFGDAGFFGSIPGLGLHPADSHLPGSLDAPIVGMVPTSTGRGYFMVASDGGVFAFGDGRFEGSCPGIGGCDGPAVAVMPDNTGNGYWLVTATGAVYSFGDAPFYGAPPTQSIAAVDAVSTPDGRGYWVLYSNGAVFGFGDAKSMGAPVGYVNTYNPATAIFPTADGRGYWVAAARGDVFSYGDALYRGSMSSTGLNGEIIAGFGF